MQEVISCIDAGNAVLNLLIVEPQQFAHISDETRSTIAMDNNFSNFVRFFVSELLPHSKLVLWADADMVFIGDVVEWMDTLFRGNNTDKLVAAGQRKLKNYNFKKFATLPPSVLSYLGYDVALNDFEFFNAGMVVINTPMWRE